MNILFSRVVSRGPPFSNKSRKLLGTLRRNGYSWETVVFFDSRGFGTWLWRAAFAFLAQASLTPSRWRQLSRRSVWAPFLRGARARAPGRRSWSVRARARTSAASCTSGSLGAISARRWSAGSKTANLALVVLRSSCDTPLKMAFPLLL